MIDRQLCLWLMWLVKIIHDFCFVMIFLFGKLCCCFDLFRCHLHLLKIVCSNFLFLEPMRGFENQPIVFDFRYHLVDRYFDYLVFDLFRFRCFNCLYYFIKYFIAHFFTQNWTCFLCSILIQILNYYLNYFLNYFAQY